MSNPSVNKRKINNNSPKQTNEILKKIKTEKKEQPVTTTKSTSKKVLTSSPTISKTESNKKLIIFEPSLKLICKICNYKYDSFEHLPVIVTDCLETCCDCCAKKLVSIHGTKFLCPLCKHEHSVPESKLYPLNKFALEILNIKISDRPNINAEKMKASIKDMESKLDKLSTHRFEKKQEIDKRTSELKQTLNNYLDQLIQKLKKRQISYLNEINNQITEFDFKFNQQKLKVCNELANLKTSLKSKDLKIDSIDLSSKYTSLENCLLNDMDKLEKLLNSKCDIHLFLKQLAQEFEISNLVRINLDFKNEILVNKKSIYSIDQNRIFYCLKEKEHVSIRVIEPVKHVIIDELKASKDCYLKYVIIASLNCFFAYFQDLKECFLVKFDVKFNNPKTLESKRELIFINSDEVMLYSNKLNNKQIKVLDHDLKPVKSFGQSLNESMPFYLLKNKTFQIIGCSKNILAIKYDLEKNLKIFSRNDGKIINEIKLDIDSDLNDDDFKNMTLKFENSSNFKIIIAAKAKMKLIILNGSDGLLMKQIDLDVKSNFDRFSLTSDDLIAFYYEKNNLIQFLKI